MVKFYSIGTLFSVVFNLISDAMILAEGGKANFAAQLLSIAGWLWFCVSGIFIVFFILKKIPVLVPVIFVVYYVLCFIAAIAMMVVCPAMIKANTFPAPLTYVDIVVELLIAALSIRLLTNYRPSSEQT